MSRISSRITLRVLDVRVERLQEISQQDALAGGWPCSEIARTIIRNLKDSATGLAAIEWFVYLWDLLNGKRGFPWSSNPWVWVVEFEVVE